MRANLTQNKIESIKAPARGQVDIWDDRMPGFGLRVSYGGAKRWVLMYRQNGIKRRLVLGRYPQMGVADARQEARRQLGHIAEGADPAQARSEARAQPTFAEFAQIYIERYTGRKKTGRAPRSVREDQFMLKADLLPVWGTRKMGDIARKDVISLLDEIVDRAPIHANRVRALISMMFNFAIDRGLVDRNPAHRVPRPAPENPRVRVLSNDEIRALWIALAEHGSSTMSGVFKMLMLTAARKSEVLGLCWRELDLDQEWWTLPAGRSKARIEHRVPLVPSVVNLLKERESKLHDTQYVFLGRRRGQPVSNPQKWVFKLRAMTGISDLRLHDIRRTVATRLTEMGVPRLTVSKLLGHAEGGITARYDMHSYDREKRAALLQWERRLSVIVSGGTAAEKVASLRA